MGELLPWERELVNWAYDEDNVRQDEDLYLAQLEYIRCLAPCADDPECPKADYILSLLDDALRAAILKGENLDLVERTASWGREGKRSEVQQFAARLLRRISYLGGIGPADLQAALTIGRDLLVSVVCEGDVRLFRETEAEWLVQSTSAPFGIAVIDKNSGRLLRYSERP